jgi:hypothetical protein
MRRVPSYMGYISNSARRDMGGIVEDLIELTSDQAKARRLPVDDLERYHGDLYRYYSEFNDLLHHIGEHHQLDPDTAETLRLNVECAILEAYLLGSASPDPRCRDGQKRIAKALAARKKGWEEPVEKAIVQAFKAASPIIPKDKEIIRAVREEMKKQGIKISDKDGFLLKRIQPHRKRAADVAKYGDGTIKEEDIPF